MTLYFIKHENQLSHQAFIFLHHSKLQTLPDFYHSNCPSKPIFFLLLCLFFTPASQTGNSRFCSHWISEDERASTEPRYQSCPSTKKLVLHYPQESRRKCKPHPDISLPHESKVASWIFWSWYHTGQISSASSILFLKCSDTLALLCSQSTCGNHSFMQRLLMLYLKAVAPSSADWGDLPLHLWVSQLLHSACSAPLCLPSNMFLPHWLGMTHLHFQLHFSSLSLIGCYSLGVNILINRCYSLRWSDTTLTEVVKRSETEDSNSWNSEILITASWSWAILTGPAYYILHHGVSWHILRDYFVCHFHCATLYFSSEVWDILIIRLTTYGSSHGKHRKQIETNHFFSNINRSSYLGNLFCQLLLLFSEITFANDQNEKEIIQEGLLCKQKEKIWLHSFLMQYFSA